MKPLNEMSWDDVPAEDQNRLIQSLGRGADYWPTDEELSELFNRWAEAHLGPSAR